MEMVIEDKIFVGGICNGVVENDLREHFKKYGEVVEALVMKDRITGKNRGFGFVRFASSDSARLALEETHLIGGKKVEVRKAEPRNEEQKQNNKLSPNGGSTDVIKTKKIFVGGLPSITEKEFRLYFEKYGTVSDTVVMYDKVTRRPRGFGFITFDSEDAVEDVVQMGFHRLKEKMVEVKKAIPKKANNDHHNDNHYLQNSDLVYKEYSGKNDEGYTPRLLSCYPNYQFPPILAPCAYPPFGYFPSSYGAESYPGQYCAPYSQSYGAYYPPAYYVRKIPALCPSPINGSGYLGTHGMHYGVYNPSSIRTLDVKCGLPAPYNGAIEGTDALKGCHDSEAEGTALSKCCDDSEGEGTDSSKACHNSEGEGTDQLKAVYDSEVANGNSTEGTETSKDEEVAKELDEMDKQGPGAEDDGQIQSTH
ncbi:Heterogeneous nuclear ribonucleoprotein 1 [Acorus calamus]|uniref:Heterogeneous nuclear ribonucleoprotein 1 n=1 Tax=Acorus calamus TaxID=4465 RepID=A0AAV9EV21_ACOCL|nr:Heterogeneous nuclear ribonucleoprotein 1 [Acorus calamus]